MDFPVDKLKVEEKLQLVDALVSASDQKSKSISVLCQGSTEDASSHIDETDLHSRGFHCIHCSKKFQKLSQYYGHLKSHRNEVSQWTCQKCPKEVSSFKSLAFLRKHERSCHSPSRTYECFYCERSFLHASSRTVHELSEHSDQARFVCQLCGKKFYKRSDLRSHLACHLSLKVNVCEVCGCSFSHISNLIRHSRLHSGIKPYLCNICDKRFTQVTSLNQHKISHHSNSLISCPALPNTCLKVFRTPLTAKQHAFRAHPNVPWEDPVATLNKKKQRKQRSYFCRTCGEEFQKIQDLKIHITSNHTMLKDETMKQSVPKKSQSLVFSKTQSDLSCKSVELDAEHIQLERDVSGYKRLEANTKEPKLFELPNNIDTTSEFKCTQSSETNQMKWFLTELDPGIICETSSPSEYELNKGLSSEKEKNIVIDVEGDLCYLDKYSFSSSKLECDQYKSCDILTPKRRCGPSRGLLGSDEDVEEVSSNSNGLNQVTDVQANLLYTDREDGESFGDILQRKVNEMDSSADVFDVNYGLCLDSCPETLPQHEILTVDDVSTDPCKLLKCSRSNHLEGLNQTLVLSDDINGFRLKNVAESISKCTDSTRDIAIDIFPDALHGIKSSDKPENLENPETVILSFGESYSALLKEMEISEDTTNVSECEDKFYKSFALDNLCTEPLLSTWDNCSVLLEDISIPDSEKFDEKARFASGNFDEQNDSLIEVQRRPCLSVSSEFVQTTPDEAIENRVNCWYQLASSKVVPVLKTEIQDPLVGKCSNIQFMVVETNQSSEPTETTDTTENRVKSLCAKEIQAVERIEISKAFKKQENMTKNKCPECDKIFLKSSNLSQHLGLHFPNMRSYECTVCNQTFSWKSSLNKHAAAHKLPQFLCDLCGKQYKCFNQIQQHKRRDHDGIRPNTCGICNKSYFRRHDLKIHERIHYNKKPYMCDECGKTFNHLSHLKRHKNVICTA